VRAGRIGIGTRKSSSLKGVLLSRRFEGREIRSEKKEKKEKKRRKIINKVT
jgi:hypothetical protein